MLFLRRCLSKSSWHYFKQEFITIKDEDFRVLVIPGHSKIPIERKELRRQRPPAPPPRYKSMPLDQDWTNVWPTSHSFLWSVVPFPVRQGYVEKSENDGIIPIKYANAELMKIPNFLHLTPSHIKKHCAAIKKFCSSWPKSLDTDEIIEANFPLIVETNDYVTDAVTVRDDRARKVTIKLRLSALHFDHHSRDKFLRLVKDRYDEKTDIITLKTDACPLRKQNYDYLIYQLIVLCHEAWKVEEWESEKTLKDMEKFYWDINQSKASLIDLIKYLKKNLNEEFLPNALKPLPKEISQDEVIISKPEVQEYKMAVEQIMNDEENIDTLERYKQSVLKLLIK